jgi:hypothetical protein
MGLYKTMVDCMIRWWFIWLFCIRWSFIRCLLYVCRLNETRVDNRVWFVVVCIRWWIMVHDLLFMVHGGS